MLQKLEQITSSLKNIRNILKEYNIDINLKEGLSSLNKIKKGFLSIAKHIRTEEDLKNSIISLCGSLQTLQRLGIDLNQHDLWFVSGYKLDLKANYEYRALLRVAAKRGYSAFVKFEYILKDEEFATSYDERNRIRIHYMDKGLPKDINLDTMEEEYKFFFCLLTINNKKGEFIHEQ